MIKNKKLKKHMDTINKPQVIPDKKTEEKLNPPKKNYALDEY